MTKRLITPDRRLIAPDRRLILPRRRALALATASLAMPAVLRAQSATSPSATFTATPTGYPGQSGNPVGFASAPGYPGSLTTFTGTLTSGTSGSPRTYSYYDFNAGNGGTDINNLSYVNFVGCRFQSNSQPNYNMSIESSGNITFSYCSWTPLASLATTVPNPAWPSSGAYPATPTTTFTTGLNCINGTYGYQYGVVFNPSINGPISFGHCDFWGFGQNGPGSFLNTTPQISIDNCWIHDACNSSPNGYHTDGIGYQNGSAGPSNVSITNCTIATIGNTNGIAFQLASSGYNNMTITGCYFSGYGFTVAMGVEPEGIGFTNSLFENNTFGTDLPWIFGPIYGDYTSDFSGSGNTWRGNKIHVISGTSPWPGSGPSFTSANNGNYIWPDSTLHTSDFAG